MTEAQTLTALLKRKLEIGESLSCRQLFADLEEVDKQIEQASRERIDLDQLYISTQAHLAEAESIASLSVEGKNEAERKAKKTQLLRDDPAYADALSAARDVERQRAEAEVNAEMLKRKARRIERQIDYRTAALQSIR